MRHLLTALRGFILWPTYYFLYGIVVDKSLILNIANESFILFVLTSSNNRKMHIYGNTKGANQILF